jgi:hypothetical protein
VRIRRVAALALAAWSALGGVAAAEEPKRPVPDYDGRPEPTTPGDVALWVPRVVLFPAYVVTEYVIRRPLGFLLTEAERAELPAALYDFFAFGAEHKAGIVPIAFVDFGFDPSVGVYMFWDDAGFDGHDLRLRFSTWGSDWLAGTLTERFNVTEHQSLTLTATAIRRPDYTFYGIGPESREDDVARYGSDSVDARVMVESRLFGSSRIEGAAGYRSLVFRPGDYDDDPTIEDLAPERFAEPPGYRRGYGGGFSSLRISLDTRDADAVSDTGARLTLEAEQGSNLRGSGTSGYIRYGGTLGGFLDLSDNGRVVSWSLSGILTDPLASGPVPFTELATLGGSNLMPGFRAGRLYDRSAIVSTLRYSWPIWIWLRGSLQTAVGNVFGAGFRGAELERARFSAAIGIESVGSRDSVFQLLLGSGTDTFESGAAFNEPHIVVGARSGF